MEKIKVVRMTHELNQKERGLKMFTIVCGFDKATTLLSSLVNRFPKMRFEIEESIHQDGSRYYLLYTNRANYKVVNEYADDYRPMEKQLL